MKDFFSQILEKYGLKAIIFAIIATVIIWIVAHIYAAPGGTVSVLWGLVQYTKEQVPKKELLIAEPIKPKDLEKDSPKPAAEPIKPKNLEKDSSIPAKENNTSTAIRIVTYPIGDIKYPTKLFVKLRASNNLRELTALESSKKLSEIPNRTYCYLTALNIHVYSHGSYKEILHEKVYRFATTVKPQYRPYEIHKISDTEIHLLGFISDDRAANDSYLTGNEIREFILSPIPLKKADHLALIPIQRIIETNDRSLDINQENNIWVLDIKLR